MAKRNMGKAGYGIGLAVVFFAGFWLGKSTRSPVPVLPSATPSAEIESPVALAPRDNIEPAVAARSSDIGTAQSIEQPSQQLNGDESQAQVQAAVENLRRSGQSTKTNANEQKDFAEEFSPANEDWQARTAFTDFIELHQYSDLITLHSIQCTSSACQLVGNFAQNHKLWGEIVEEMKQQDWWDYSGTSSSTSSEDGDTVFVLYVSKD